MFSVYILQSLKTGRYYTGSCDDLQKRIARHNAGRVTITKFGVPWQLVYSEPADSRSEARKRELQIKSYKGGNAFKRLIKK